MMSGGRGTGLRHPLPARAVFGVVELDAHRKQLLTDFVRTGEIATIAGGLAFGNEALDLGVGRLWKLDDVQDLIGVPEHRRCGCTFLGRRGPRLEPGIELADEVEQVTDGCRQVQIVAQGVIPEVENSPPTLALPPLGGGNLNIGGYPQADGEFVQALDRPFRRLQQLGREGERAAVVCAGHQRVSNRAWMVTLLDEITQGREVLQALRHLLADRVLQMLGVQPIADEGLVGAGFALGDLVLVVRKDVVDAAGMDVEALAQVLHAHRRALDVPAGPARAERSLPRLLFRLARLPEDEVARIVLAVVIDVDARPGLEALDVEMRKRAIAREGRDPEVG